MLEKEAGFVDLDLSSFGLCFSFQVSIESQPKVPRDLVTLRICGEQLDRGTCDDFS